MKLEECLKLPDRISIEECAEYFKKALSCFYKNEITKQEFLDILLELTDRQVMTYEIIEKNLRNELDKCIVSLWNTDSYDDVDSILSIVAKLGLEKTYVVIKESLNNVERMSEDIYYEIKDCVEENGDNISNPYRFLDKE